MKCRRCKREITDNSLYCSWCGVKQIADGKVNVPKPKRLASGEYANRIQVDKQRVYVKARTEAEYYKKATALKMELVDIKNAPANESLDEAIKDYINSHEAIFSPATVRGYLANGRQIKKHTDGKIKDIDFQLLINQLSAEYSPKTVKNQWGVITATLKYKKIPVPDVKLPPAKKTERNFLDPDEIKRFIKAIEGKSFELAALLALHSLRVSEILALDGDSVKDGIIHVRGAVVEDRNNKYVHKDTNKTISSTRDIPVFIPRLTELWTGDPHIPHQSSLTRDIKRVCRHNALPEVTTHGLRHSFCSLAYFQGWDIKTTQLVGGWSSPRVPTEIYTHLSKNRYNEDIKKMAAFYQKTTEKTQ